MWVISCRLNKSTTGVSVQVVPRNPRSENRRIVHDVNYCQRDIIPVKVDYHKTSRICNRAHHWSSHAANNKGYFAANCYISIISISSWKKGGGEELNVEPEEGGEVIYSTGSSREAGTSSSLRLCITHAFISQLLIKFLAASAHVI